MSIKIMNRVWEQSSHEQSMLLLLLALADHASDDGVCYPGIPRLALKIRRSERHTKRLIAELEESGEVFVDRGAGRGYTNLYFIVLGFSEEEIAHTLTKRYELSQAEATKLARQIVENRDRKGDIDDTISDKKGDAQGREKVTSGAEKVTPKTGKGDKAMSSESSLTVIKSSVRNRQAEVEENFPKKDYTIVVYDEHYQEIWRADGIKAQDEYEAYQLVKAKAPKHSDWDGWIQGNRAASPGGEEERDDAAQTAQLGPRSKATPIKSDKEYPEARDHQDFAGAILRGGTGEPTVLSLPDSRRDHAPAGERPDPTRLDLARRTARARAEAGNIAVPPPAGGDDGFQRGPVDAFCEVLAAIAPDQLPKKQRRSWGLKLGEIAREWSGDDRTVTPEVMEAAIRAVPEDEFVGWRSFSSPYSDNFDKHIGPLLLNGGKPRQKGTAHGSHQRIAQGAAPRRVATEEEARAILG